MKILSVLVTFLAVCIMSSPAAVASAVDGGSFASDAYSRRGLSVESVTTAPAKSLYSLQQEFVDMRLGMFIHFNISTYVGDDWPDPDTPASLFNPTRLDCDQWAEAAASAHASFGCLTAKHHSGFCIWDTATTDYSVASSPFDGDVVAMYADAFRARGLKVALYYSILDTHHDIRPGFVTPESVDMIKAQLTELLTSYGPIAALFIDGWDTPWSRISYDEVPFEDIYRLVKSLQPECLVMELNAGKYPHDGLYYTDIKSYEQNAGQHVSTATNVLPAVSSLPVNKSWFWKPDFPTSPVKSAESLVRDNLLPLNEAYCVLLLNVAPNRDGLIDDNALEVFREIGRLWDGPAGTLVLKETEAPIISENIAIGKRCNTSWAYDIHIADFLTDDDFTTRWQSHSSVAEPWAEVVFDRALSVNAISIADSRGSFTDYRVEYFADGRWRPVLNASGDVRKVKIRRFDRIWAEKVRVYVTPADKPVTIDEIGIYDERGDTGSF